jgi:DNA-binding CsgD family transcriptional regulator
VELLGRERELDAAARAVDAARAGAVRGVALLGEAGIGKSALLAAIADRAAEAGLRVLHGRGVEHERAVPFALVVDAFDRWVAALHPARLSTLGTELGDILPAAGGPPGRPAVERIRYHRALRALVELLSRETPVALVLDDLHWADEASLEFVLHLLRRPPDAPLLLAFALRRPVPRLVDAVRAAPGFEPLDLGPLERRHALALLAGVTDPRRRERIALDAAGNPFFLRELARAATVPGDSLPRTVVASIQIEVAALDDEARALLQGAAVAGDPFDPELAAAATGGTSPVGAALDRLVAADLVRASDGRSFAFRHPLVRRAVYDGAPPAWRLDAHERVAGALERRGARPAMRAYHVAQFARPGDAAAIALLAEAAGDAAATAPATAAHWYGAALRLLGEDAPGRRADLLAARASALAGAGRLVESRAALVDALEQHAGPPPSALVTACAQVETELGHHASARRRLEAALPVASPEDRAAFAFELAAGAFYAGYRDDLRAWSLPAVRAAADADDEVTLVGAEALDAVGARWSGEPASANAALARATAGFWRLQDATFTARPAAAVYVALAQHLAERYSDAAATSTRALDIAGERGLGHVLVPLLLTRAMARGNLLELDRARRDAETAEDMARLQGVPRLVFFAVWVHGRLQHHRGETAAVARAIAECAQLVHELEPSSMTRTGLCSLAAIRADADPAAAIRDMTAIAGPQLEGIDPTWRSSMLLTLVRAAIATGALEDAERWAGCATDFTARWELPVGRARADCARAELLLARGDAGSAAALAGAAADRLPAALDALDARLVAGRAYAAAGRAERAKAALARVVADADRGGAVRLAAAAARELRRLGVRTPSQGHRPGGGGLSERERRIAELVAEGHANKQIAATLHLSEKTIRNSLTRIYAKLGVRSRTQLAARLRA